MLCLQVTVAPEPNKSVDEKLREINAEAVAVLKEHKLLNVVIPREKQHRNWYNRRKPQSEGGDGVPSTSQPSDSAPSKRGSRSPPPRERQHMNMFNSRAMHRKGRKPGRKPQSEGLTSQPSNGRSPPRREKQRRKALTTDEIRDMLRKGREPQSDCDDGTPSTSQPSEFQRCQQEEDALADNITDLLGTIDDGEYADDTVYSTLSSTPHREETDGCDKPEFNPSAGANAANLRLLQKKRLLDAIAEAEKTPVEKTPVTVDDFCRMLENKTTMQVQDYVVCLKSYAKSREKIGDDGRKLLRRLLNLKLENLKSVIRKHGQGLRNYGRLLRTSRLESLKRVLNELRTELA